MCSGSLTLCPFFLDQNRLRPTTPNEQESLAQEFSRLCQELWVVTGDACFRQIETRGEILSEDLTNSVTRYL
jgi:hypothetical protein